MQDPDNSNNNKFHHNRIHSEDDVDMDTDTERLLALTNDIIPTITDDFEEDLQREVAYAPGLMAATEGENVILSHQVSNFEQLPPTACLKKRRWPEALTKISTGM